MGRRERIVYISGLILLILFVGCSGCVGGGVYSKSPSDEPRQGEVKVYVDGYWKVEPGGLLRSPVPIMVQTTATNMGDVDAKSVQAKLKLTYNGRTLGQQTEYYGTVKVGIPVKKETVMSISLSPEELSQVQKTGSGIDLTVEEVKVS